MNSMDSLFYYSVTTIQDSITGASPVIAPWVHALPVGNSGAPPSPTVVVLENSNGAQPSGMYLWNGTQWKMVLPYQNVALAIVQGASIILFSGMTQAYTTLPATAALWKNSVQAAGTTVAAGITSVWAAVVPPAGAAAGSVASVNGATPDVNGNIRIPVATSMVAGTVKGGGNVTIAADGTLSVNISAAGVQSVSGQMPDGSGNVVIRASDANAATGTSLIVGDGSGSGNIRLKTVVAGVGITLAPDSNGNLQITGAPQPATTSTAGVVKVGSGLLVDGSGTLTTPAYALLFSPTFTGNPAAPTPATNDNSTRLATTAFVSSAISSALPGGGLVSSFNTRTGAVTLQASDVSSVGGALLASPALTGTPTAPTAIAGTNTTQLATTAFVAASYAPLLSPAFSGTPTAPTPASNNNSTNIATTAFVQSVLAAITGGLNYQGTWNASTNTPALTSGVGTKGFLYVVSVAGSTTLDGNSTWAVGDFVNFNGTVWQRIPAQSVQVSSFNTRTGAITLSLSDVTTALGFTPANATALSGYAPLASPALTGTPTAPTAAPGTNTTQLATTAFVAASYAPLASPALTGTPTAPTPTAGNNSTTIATTAFVTTAVSSAINGNAVTSFNTRTGAVTLQASDVSGVGGALLASPTFTGVPAAPTATPGTNTTQLATTAFVAAAVSAGSVTAFNSRTGAVTLQASDISGVGGALLASPALTGTPTAPTAAPGTNTTQLATTAFVQTVVAGSSVSSFNSRTGAVTLQASDVTGVGGALLASPSFTGRVQAPATSYTVTALGNVSGSVTMDLATASEWTMTITGATTFGFTNTLAANLAEVVYLRLTNAGTAAITWPASTKFAAKTAPTFTAAGIDLLGVKYDTVTSTYMVFVVGLNIG